MRILLDACVPKQLGQQLSGFEVRTVPDLGWGDLDDGPLLERMAGFFDVLVTTDKSIPRQQRIENRTFGVIVLRGRTNRLADLLPLIEALRKTLKDIRPGETREVARPL